MEETPGRASLEKLGCRTPPQLNAGGVGRQQQQQLLEFVFESVYVDLQYDEVYLTFTAGYVWACVVFVVLW